MNVRAIIPYAVWSLPAGWTVLIFLLLTRKVHRYVPGWMPPWADKPAHMLLFGSLAIFTYVAFRHGSSVKMMRATGLSFFYAASYGAIMEWYQYYIPWRTADWADVIANTVGAAVVFVIYFFDEAFLRTRPVWAKE